MNQARHKKDRGTIIRDLYPKLSDEQLDEAEEILGRYIELAVRMYKRIKADPEAYARFIALTDKRLASRIKSGQSNLPNPS